MVGSIQYAVSLGIIDIKTSTMIMSLFKAIPMKYHLQRTKCMYSYVSKMRHATTRIRTDEPDFSSLPDGQNTWDQSIYGTVKEEIPKDIPKPLGTL